MTQKTNRIVFALRVLTVLLIGLSGIVSPATAASGDTESPAAVSPKTESGEPSSSIAQTEKMAEAGEKIGKGLDRLSQTASRHLGDWINVRVFAGITWLKLLFCLALVFLVILVERIVYLVIRAKLKHPVIEKREAQWAEQLLDALARPLTLFIWTYGIYAALSPLFGHFRTPQGANLVQTVATKAADIGVVVALFWFIYRLVAIVDIRLKRWAAGTDSSIDDILVPIVAKTLRVFIVVIGGIIVIQSLTGVKFGPLLASLGIGGLAVALAAKDSIANFFGTVTILLDKPFQIGDRVVVNNVDGVVENVGFRSTRIRTLTGHLVTIPNETLVNTSTENIGKRPHIRWLTNIGITYDTPPEKVEAAVQAIREILADHEGMDPEFPPRAYFNGFNDSSLNIMVVAWYHPPDWWGYSEWLHNTCLAIMRRFQDEGIDFAFPSRTVYLAGDDKRRLTLGMLKGDVPPDIKAG